MDIENSITNNFYLPDTIGENTAKNVFKIMDYIKSVNYNILLEFQKNNTYFKRFDFNLSEVKPLENIPEFPYHMANKRYYRIRYSFISESVREKINKTQFLFKELDSDMISKNRNCFDKNFIVFINGKVSLFTKILCTEEFVYIIFDLNKPLLPSDKNTIEKNTDFYTLFQNKVDVSILFFSNGNRVSGPTTVRDLDKYNGVIPFSYHNYDVTELDPKKYKGKYLTFISTDNTNGMVLYDVNNENGKFIFDRTRYKQSYGRFLVDSLEIPNLSYEVRLKPGTKTFKLETDTMPIPVENFIIFYRDKKGYRLFDHNAKIRSYYPNIYQIYNTSLTREISIFVLYTQPSKDTMVSFKDYSSKLFEYNDNLLRQFTMNIAPECLKNFKEPDIVSNISDYNKSGYKNPFLYTVDKLYEYLMNNPEYVEYFYKAFMTDQMKSYHIYVENTDLNRRIRYDSTREGGNEIFEKPCYCFSISNLTYSKDYSKMSRAILVDGLLIEPDYTYKNDNGIEYIYFYMEKIKPDTIIEVMINKSNHFEIEQYIDTYNKFYEIDLSEINKYCMLLNMAIINENDLPIEREDIEVQIMGYDGEYKTINELSYMEKIGKMRFRIKNIKYIKTTLKIILDNDESIYHVHPKNSNENAISYETSQYFTNYHQYSYQAYINGRKVPVHTIVNKDGHGCFNNKSIVNTLVKRYSGDNVSYIKTPVSYRQIYYSESIPEDGIIDLTEFTVAPLSFEYNSFYLNGRKLYSRNIEFLSSSIIRLKGIDSLKNFEVMERCILNRDFFNFIKPMENSITNKLYDLFKDNIPKEKIKDVDTTTFELIRELDIENADYINKFIHPLEGTGNACDDIIDITNVKYSFPNMVCNNVCVIGDDEPYLHDHIEIYGGDN